MLAMRTNFWQPDLSIQRPPWSGIRGVEEGMSTYEILKNWAKLAFAYYWLCSESTITFYGLPFYGFASRLVYLLLWTMSGGEREPRHSMIL